MDKKIVWLVNPYGPIEGENWREYSYNQFGKYLSMNGYRVIWWTANFSHHFKKYRSKSWKDICVNKDYIIRLVPTSSYKKNFGVGRLIKDLKFGKNAYRKMVNIEPPNLIIATENPLTLGSPTYRYVKYRKTPYIYDQMDIWPEFIINKVPRGFRWIANILFFPAKKKRARIYDEMNGCIALGKHYLEFMMKISPSLKNKPSALVYNGIDVPLFRSQLSNPIAVQGLPKKSKDDIWCVFAGTLGPSYDIKGIVECAKMCLEKGLKEFKIIIAGSGPLEKYVFEQSQKIDNLFFVGHLLPSQLIPIYGSSDIGLCAYSASSNVDMCDKFYDYTASGLAIINSLRGEIAEHIDELHLGINYDVKNANSLFKAVSSYLDRETLQNAKRQSFIAGSFFDMNNQNRKLLDVIEKIIK